MEFHPEMSNHTNYQVNSNKLCMESRQRASFPYNIRSETREKKEISENQITRRGALHLVLLH